MYILNDLHLQVHSADYAPNRSKCLLFFVLSKSEGAPLVRDDREDLFGIEQSSQDFLEVKKTEYVGYKKRAQRDSELLFTPSFRTGNLQSANQIH